MDSRIGKARTFIRLEMSTMATGDMARSMAMESTPTSLVLCTWEVVHVIWIDIDV